MRRPYFGSLSLVASLVTMRPCCQTSTSRLITSRLADSTAAASSVQSKFTASMKFLANDVGSIIGHGRPPIAALVGRGEFSHSLMCLAVSICRAFRRSSSRSGPGFSRDAFCSSRALCSANRSWNVCGCDVERSMDHSSCLNQAGACSTLSHRQPGTVR